MRQVIFLIIFICVTINSVCAEVKVLTLEDSIEYALSSNKGLDIVKEKIAETEAGVIKSRAALLPALSISGNYVRLNEVSEVNLGGGLNFKTGQLDNFGITSSLQQYIFSGFRNSSAYANSKYGLELSKEDYNKELNSTVYSVTRAFYNAVLAEELVKLNEESYDQMKKHTGQVRVRYENGLSSKLDMLRAEVQLANMNPALIRARNNLRLAFSTLKTLIGMSAETVIKLEGALEYAPVSVEFEDAVKEALENRPEIKSMRISEKIARNSIKIARSGGLPSLIASYNYKMDRPYQSMDEWGSSWNCMLNVNIPVFKSFYTSADVAQARSRVDQIDISMQLLQDNIRLEVEQAFFKIKQEEETILSQNKNVEQAKEALDIAETRYRNGLITNLEFLDTQLAHIEAMLNLLQSKADYIVANAELKKATGK
ncbi:MAG: TolC family protein [Elusimicrobiota bacterium]